MLIELLTFINRPRPRLLHDMCRSSLCKSVLYVYIVPTKNGTPRKNLLLSNRRTFATDIGKIISERMLLTY